MRPGINRPFDRTAAPFEDRRARCRSSDQERSAIRVHLGFRNARFLIDSQDDGMARLLSGRTALRRTTDAHAPSRQMSDRTSL
jgi:hypothetical protein